MNDTNISERQQNILTLLSTTTTHQSSEVLRGLHESFPSSKTPSLVTVKRDLDHLTEGELCVREGKGRTTGYRLTPRGRLLRPFAIDAYIARIPDDRTTYTAYVHDFFDTIPPNILSDTTKDTLDAATERYQKRVAAASPTIRAREMERFVIELSWKSSAIEGNTYTLLDTEKLIREGVPALGHDASEAQMILNHKRALEFVVQTVADTNQATVGQRFVEQVHELLVAELGVGTGLRSSFVGVTGSAYVPLDNQYQIRDALTALYTAIERLEHPVEKGLLTLAGLSYIQPFEDGNKRTARLVSNALLLAHSYAPLSYRNVDIEAYRSAMLIFYEQLSITAVRDIFVDQYAFSTEHYLVPA